MTEASRQALDILRATDHFQWQVVPMIIILAYLLINELQKGNFSAVYLAVALWGAELVWEMINGLVLHFSGFAPMWCTPGNTSFLIYVGLPVEISIFFAMGALTLVKAIPKDQSLKIAGINNRIIIPALAALSAVIAEAVLNRVGVLVWAWRWWGWPHIWVIFINYWWPAMLLVWAHDRASLRSKRRAAVIGLALAAGCHLVFATWLKWV